MFNPLHQLRYWYYLWSAKRAAHNRKRLHLKIGDVKNFLLQLKELEVPYVIIRWWQDTPMTHEAETAKGKNGDIDLLVEASAIPKLLKAAACHPGKIKLDLKSNRQVYGTDTKRMTYYPPAFSDELLKNRVEENGYFRANDKLALYAFAYYIVYHNGASGMIPSGLPGIDSPEKHKPDTRHDRVAELKRLAAAADEKLPQELTLLNLHFWLMERGWNMPFDLLPRYPVRNPFIDALYEKNCDVLESEMGGKNDLCVYLIREDAVKANAQDDIIKAVSDYFDLMATVELDEAQQERVLRQTRGGDWTKRKKIRMYLPKIALLCHGRTPLIHRGIICATQKEKLVNPNIVFKHQLREKFALKFQDADDFMHGSDNDLESFYYFKTIYGTDWQKRWNELYRW